MDTETVLIRLDAYLQIVWRKTYDYFKDETGKEDVFVFPDGSVYVGIKPY